jgi:ABC-type transporter Mla subunit MlaD
MTNHDEQVNHFRIGIFVLLGTILLVTFVIMVVGGNWFHQPTYMETYFDESVQGLNEGSTVKYRGVSIGRVKNISFIGDQYYSNEIARDQNVAKYVYVKMALDTVSFLGNAKLSVAEKLHQAIKNGLRVHLAQEGLTGNSYIELDFSKTHRDSLQIKWRPKLYYIPSRQSTLSTISASLNTMFNDLQKVNFNKFFHNITRTAHSARKSFDHISSLLESQETNIAVSLENVADVTDSLRLIMENISTYPSGFLRTGPDG